jgi:glutathione S-transferase
MKLYYSPGACSLATHIAAKEEGLALELERVDLKTHRTEYGEDFRRLNPKGYVPALELDDGTLLTENVAILVFIADQMPESGLAPPCESMERSRLLEWLAFLATELHKAFGPIFHHGDDTLKAEARETIEKWLAYIADRLAGHEFLMGDQFTVADAYLFVMLRWCDLAQIPLGQFPVLASYRVRIAVRPAVQAAMREERLKP